MRNSIIDRGGAMSLNNGFYESVINNLIDEEIHKLRHQKEYYIDKKQIDEEESSSILSKYMSIVINKSLNRISGKEKLSKQIEICNKIVSYLEHLINEVLYMENIVPVTIIPKIIDELEIDFVTVK